MLHVFMVMILGMNGIAVARNGPILWENDATGSRKVFKYLLDLWDTINKSKNVAKVQKFKNIVFSIQSLYRPLWSYCLLARSEAL